METKPGIKTTEFWLTIAVDLAALLSALAGALPPKWAGAINMVATGLYALSRGWSKSKAPYNPNQHH
jgi:hypothetical protein